MVKSVAIGRFAALLMLPAVAVVALVLFGILGVGRGNAEAFADVKYWYVSTRMWFEGLNPYDYEQLKLYAQGLGIGLIERYAYPPVAFVLGLALSPFSLGAAKLVWTVLSLGALALIVMALYRIYSETFVSGGDWGWRDRAIFAVLTTIVVGNPFVAHVVWTGQTTLIIAAALIWAWRFIYAGKDLAGGVLLALAACKPQFSVLVFFWLLLDRKFLVLASATVAAVLFAAVPFVGTGFSIVGQWLGSMQGYQGEVSKVLGVSNNSNLRSVLFAFGLSEKPFNLLWDASLAVLVTFIVWLRQKDAGTGGVAVLAVLIGLALLFVSGRDYDYAALAPLLVAALYLRGESLVLLTTLTGLMVAMFVPHRLVETLGVPGLLMWRPITLALIFAIAGWVAYSSGQRAGNRVGA